MYQWLWEVYTSTFVTTRANLVHDFEYHMVPSYHAWITNIAHDAGVSDISHLYAPPTHVRHNS